MNEPMQIELFEDDKVGLVHSVSQVLKRMGEGCRGYHNSRAVVRLQDRTSIMDAISSTRVLPMYLTDVLALGAMTRTPVALRGGTDQGKTEVAERALNALFGPSGEGWWRTEVNAGMSIDDLLDVDFGKLEHSKLSSALSAARWLTFPAILLDEINRAPAKLANMLLHIADGKGLHTKANMPIPVGYSYTVDGVPARYSFVVATANKQNGEYDGVFEEDAALTRRLALSIDMDVLPPTPTDIHHCMSGETSQDGLPTFEPMLPAILRIYRSLENTIDMSPLAQLFVFYLSGIGTCIRTRSGRFIPGLKREICEGCHLSKSNAFCGRVGGLSVGLLQIVRRLAVGIAVIRAAKALEHMREMLERKRGHEVQAPTGSEDSAAITMERLEEDYIRALNVTGEDVVSAFSLVASQHVYIDEAWLNSQKDLERSRRHAVQRFASKSWDDFRGLLNKHEGLIGVLATQACLGPELQAELEALVTCEDAAMISVLTALRDEAIPPLQLPGTVPSAQPQGAVL